MMHGSLFEDSRLSSINKRLASGYELSTEVYCQDHLTKKSLCSAINNEMATVNCPKFHDFRAGITVQTSTREKLISSFFSLS